MTDATGTRASPLAVSMAGPETHDVVRRLALRFLPRESRVVDLAAGQGAFTEILRTMGHAVVPVDGTAEHWRVADLPLVVRDLDAPFAEALRRLGAGYDAVVALEIIEHLENPFRFARECAALLRPGGWLLLSTPNVESVRSRLTFLYTGRLSYFGAYETVRPAHVTPIFKWKLDMMLGEAGFDLVYECFTRPVYATGRNLKGGVAAVVGRLLSPWLKGPRGGDGRIVVAKLRDQRASSTRPADGGGLSPHTSRDRPGGEPGFRAKPSDTGASWQSPRERRPAAALAIGRIRLSVRTSGRSCRTKCPGSSAIVPWRLNSPS